MAKPPAPPAPSGKKGGKAPSSIIGRARQQIEMQMRQAENDHKRQLLKKSLEMITNAVEAHQKKKPGLAVANYKAYLHIIEEIKGTPSGGLTPAHFDMSREMGDLLMLSGVYWDLARLYDRTESDERRREFLSYMEKFLLFTKGFPWQPLCAESLRRYINSGRPKHTSDFKNAYKMIGSGKCYVISALSDHTEWETVERLRRFRDERLSRTVFGRVLIRVYYRVGPGLADLTHLLPDAVRVRLARLADQAARAVST